MIERYNLDGSRTATFSDCKAFRYELLIVWDRAKPLLANIGLNPSTADEMRNDPTISRDTKRADALGFGSLLKLNLFAIRSTDPKGMMAAPDPYGEWTRPLHILRSIERNGAAMVIAAWGNHGRHRGRSDAFRDVARRHDLKLYAYELNKTGEPVHPLYKPYALKPSPYEFTEVAHA